jgi:uncharacterized lipoprotein NlpE involved in copper resistance
MSSRILLVLAVLAMVPIPIAYSEVPVLPFTGEMRYMADAALFTDCRTGRTYPIAMEADYLNMERAYLKAVVEPGAPLYVTFEGFIMPRPKMVGEGLEPTVVVERFINVWPEEKCGRGSEK